MAGPTFKSINDRLTRTVVSAIGAAGPGQAVLAEAPPGAGKSTLTCSVAQRLVTHQSDLQLPIVTQTNEQADDIVRSLHKRYPTLTIGRLTGGGGPSAAVQALLSTIVRADSHVDSSSLSLARVVVGTARKWQYERARLAPMGRQFPIALIDEAYQMRSDALLGVATLFETLFCVGDPGQIDPFSTIDDSIWRGLPYSPTRSAMGTLRAFHPDLEPIQLPTSWRLPPSAAGIVSTAFYPYAGFTAGTEASQRSLTLKGRSRQAGPADSLLEAAATTGWAYLELPERITVRTDDEIAAALASLVRTARLRAGTVVDELTPDGYPLTLDRVAVITAHNDQVAAVRYHLQLAGEDPDAVVVSTANKIQGREYDLVLVWHPLAGRRDATTFHLEAGRMCVMLSRHRHACVVVGRSGADRLLAEFPDSDPIFLDEPEKFPDGWQANYEVLRFLSGHSVPARW